MTRGQGWAALLILAVSAALMVALLLAAQDQWGPYVATAIEAAFARLN